MGISSSMDLLRKTSPSNMKILFVLGICSYALAAPQYGNIGGGGGGQNQPQRAPAPSVSCRTEYTTIWDTEYIETETEECNTIYVNSCSTQYRKQCANVPRQECQTVQDRQCSTVYNEVCVDKYRTEYDSYTETECSTEYKDDCEFQWEGEGNAKVWVPIPGTCKSNPYETCKDVPKQKER